MMKKILIAIGVIVIVALLAVWFVHLDPAVGTERITDPNRYMEVNASTQQFLTDYSSGMLPSETTISLDDCVYEYSYDCRVFGDPRCFLYLCNTFSDEDAFKMEQQRIQDISNRTYTLDNDQTLYSTTTELEEYFDIYTDEIIEDGRKCVFEYAIVDTKARNIEYVFAVQHDGQPKNDIILRALGKVLP